VNYNELDQSIGNEQKRLKKKAVLGNAGSTKRPNRTNRIHKRRKAKMRVTDEELQKASEGDIKHTYIILRQLVDKISHLENKNKYILGRLEWVTQNLIQNYEAKEKCMTQRTQKK